MLTAPLSRLIDDYKQDPNLTYQTWFLHNEDRLKAFRSIRRGVLQVISDIKDGSFPNDFKGSSLEFVLTCITEQKQVFEGASHPFYWKPKLRIPDIYENQDHKRYFGQFLECCLKTNKPDSSFRSLYFKSNHLVVSSARICSQSWSSGFTGIAFPFSSKFSSLTSSASVGSRKKKTSSSNGHPARLLCGASQELQHGTTTTQSLTSGLGL